MRPLGAAVSDELAGALADPAARIVTPESLGGALAAHLRRLGAHQAMLAPLQGERKPIGAILMANRTGTGGSFGRADLKLFETLARQTGAALGQDRLTTKVSELRELQRELEHQAFHDPLTGLANRLLFMDRVDHTLKRRQGNAVVLFVDLDDFKPINDTYGHDAGDAVLMAAAERLRGSLRAADTAARLGGDEFAVLLVDIADEHIGVVADRIIDNLLRPLDFGDRTLDVKASLGIATAQSGAGVTADELVRNADVAMYVSKHGGKDRLPHYDAAAASGRLRPRQPCASQLQRGGIASNHAAARADAPHRRSSSASLPVGRRPPRSCGPCQNRALPYGFSARRLGRGPCIQQSSADVLSRGDAPCLGPRREPATGALGGVHVEFVRERLRTSRRRPPPRWRSRPAGRPCARGRTSRRRRRGRLGVCNTALAVAAWKNRVVEDRPCQHTLRAAHAACVSLGSASRCASSRVAIRAARVPRAVAIASTRRSSYRST